MESPLTRVPNAHEVWEEFAVFERSCQGTTERESHMIHLTDRCHFQWPRMTHNHLFVSCNLRIYHCTCTHTTQLFYGPFSGTTRVSRSRKKSSGLYGAREDIIGRHTDNPAGRHSMQTNQRPTSFIPHFYARCHSCRNPPNQFILVWERHQICWLAYPAAWLSAER